MTILGSYFDHPPRKADSLLNNIIEELILQE